MCLAVPAVLMQIQGDKAEADTGGVKRFISLALTPEARVGDYVMIHAGFAISVIEQEEAVETVKLLKDLEAFTNSIGRTRKGGSP